VTDLAEIFQKYGKAYRTKYGQRMPSSHKVTMRAIEQCRTEQLGGHVYICESCQVSEYSYSNSQYD
jgi:hypothetical protein